MTLGVRAPRQGSETFSQSHPWWTRADHDALLTVIARVKPVTVLEFGPGVSTLCFLEGGVRAIDTFEDREDWYDFHRPLFAPHVAIRHRMYRHADPLRVPTAAHRYDLAFVDGPRWVHDRAPELAFARDRCRAVALHDFWYPEIRKMVSDLFDERAWAAWQYVTQPDEAIGLLVRT